MKNLTLSVIASLLTLIGTILNATQPDAKTSREFFQDWQLSCTEKGDLKKCVVTQELQTDTGQTVAVVNISYMEEEITVELAVPLMMDLTLPVVISVDGQSVDQYAYNVCNQKACFVLIKGDEALIEAFKKGKEAVMMLKAYSGQDIEMKVSLKGMSIALANLIEK